MASSLYITQDKQTVENGIPVFTDYSNLTRYMSIKLNDNNLLEKMKQLKSLLPEISEKPENQVLKLNRMW